jgi:hypothetical protein
VPFVTLVGLTLDALVPFVSELTQLPAAHGAIYVEFTWGKPHSLEAPRTPRFRWMRAGDGR